MRTCVGCRGKGDQAELVRLALTPGGIEISRTAPGRGAWLHPGCGELALKRRAIPRALRAEVVDQARLAAVVAAVATVGPAWANQGSSH